MAFHKKTLHKKMLNKKKGVNRHLLSIWDGLLSVEGRGADLTSAHASPRTRAAAGLTMRGRPRALAIRSGLSIFPGSQPTSQLQNTV